MFTLHEYLEALRLLKLQWKGKVSLNLLLAIEEEIDKITSTDSYNCFLPTVEQRVIRCYECDVEYEEDIEYGKERDYLYRNRCIECENEEIYIFDLKGNQYNSWTDTFEEE